MPEKTPNVLVLLSDQHHADLLSCAGHAQVKTPNLDALAARGIRLSRAYAANPICLPSRVSLHSGQWCHNHGCYGNEGNPPKLPSFLGHFRQHGYKTAALGKVHVPSFPQNWLYDHVDRFAHVYRNVAGSFETSPYYEYLQSEGVFDDQDALHVHGVPIRDNPRNDARPSNQQFEHCNEMWIARQGQQFIEDCVAAGDPFCAYVSFPRPHHPLTPDIRFWEMYPEDIELPETFGFPCDHRPPHFQNIVEISKESRHWQFEPKEYEAGFKRIWRGYLALISQVDHAVGCVIETLDRLGVRDETIVVYGSDHGAYHGHFGVIEKAPGICSEAVCRTPVIMDIGAAFTDAPRGEVCNGLASLIDIAPTLTGLAGIPEMLTVDGKNLTPMLCGEADSVHEVVVTENPWGKALRVGDWRYVHYPERMFDEDWGELYNLKDDPYETKNLYFDADHSQTVHSMKTHLVDWLIKSTRQVTVNPQSEYAAGGGPLELLAGDGKEGNHAGVQARIDRGVMNYL